MMSGQFGGVYAAMLTPFDSRGNLDLSAAGRLAQRLLDAGLSGICPCGTTGEFPQLSLEEKRAVNQAVIGALSGRGKTVAGIWDPSSDGRRALAAAAEKDGAEAVFLTTPIFYPATASSLLAWYRQVKGAAGLPLFAYNIPQFTTNEIPLDVLATLADEGTIQGYKESSPDASRLEGALGALRGKVPAFAGNEKLYDTAIGWGAAGFISGIAGIFPGAVRGAWKGDREAFESLKEIKDAIGGNGGIAAMKFILNLRGYGAGTVRDLVAPLEDSSRRFLETLNRRFDALGV